jgi:hypothetical protein
MKRSLLFLLAILVAASLLACRGQQPAATGATLTVSGGDVQRTYSASDLRTFPVSLATVEGITYVGVSLTMLLEDAGFIPDQIELVMAVAGDDFSATYEPDLFMRQDAVVAYERVDADLAADEQPFRMALPGQPGRLNVRMLSRIVVHQ